MTKKPNKSMDADAPAVKQFVKVLRSYAPERSDREKFRDWCEACYCAYAKLSALAMADQARADALEARYMRIVNSYEDKDYLRTAWVQMKALGEDALEQGGRDYLGVIAGELNALDEGQGQFFTPYEVSKFMAKFNLHDMKAHIEREGFFTLCEPAVGSGGMVIAAADELAMQGFDPMMTMLVEAWDISTLAYQMCFLQFCWRGITAHVVRGNTLSQEIFEDAWTPFMPLFYNRHGRLFGPRQKSKLEEVFERMIALDRAQAVPPAPEMTPAAPMPTAALDAVPDAVPDAVRDAAPVPSQIDDSTEDSAANEPIVQLTLF